MLNTVADAYRRRYEAKQPPPDDGYDYPMLQVPMGDFRIIMQKAEREGRVIRRHPKYEQGDSRYEHVALVEGSWTEFKYWGFWICGVPHV